MLVCEIFLSIQGESSFSGLPCIFIRLAGCNLSCKWCDTRYHNENPRFMTIEEILAETGKYEGIELVEVTGGEPLLQNETGELLDTLVAAGYEVLLETNGSQFLEGIALEVHKIVDVKCPSSGEEGSFKRQNLLYLNPGLDEIKFVIADSQDFAYARDFINYNNLWGYKLLFSCVYQQLKPAKLVEWILQDKLPVRFQLQMQKYIWDEKERRR